jgi:hypothetical protein
MKLWIVYYNILTCAGDSPSPPPQHDTLFMPRAYLGEMASAGGGARATIRAAGVRDFGTVGNPRRN